MQAEIDWGQLGKTRNKHEDTLLGIVVGELELFQFESGVDDGWLKAVEELDSWWEMQCAKVNEFVQNQRIRSRQKHV